MDATTDGKLAGLIALATIGGGILTTLGSFLWQWIKDNRAVNKEEKQTIVDHLTKRVERLEAEKANADRRARRMNRRLRETENRATQMLAHIRYVDGLLKGAGVKYEGYAEIPLPPEADEGEESQPGTGLHAPIPPTQGT